MRVYRNPGSDYLLGYTVYVRAYFTQLFFELGSYIFKTQTP